MKLGTLDLHTIVDDRQDDLLKDGIHRRLHLGIHTLQHARLALLEGGLVEHEVLRLLDAAGLLLAPDAVHIAGVAEGIFPRACREVGGDLRGCAMLHGIESSAKRFFLRRMALQIGRAGGLAGGGLGASGIAPGLQQRPLPRCLVALGTAPRADSEIAPGMVFILGRVLDPIRRGLEFSASALECDLGKGLILVAFGHVARMQFWGLSQCAPSVNTEGGGERPYASCLRSRSTATSK